MTQNNLEQRTIDQLRRIGEREIFKPNFLESMYETLMSITERVEPDLKIRDNYVRGKVASYVRYMYRRSKAKCQKTKL